jgi:hypothetical protein
MDSQAYTRFVRKYFTRGTMVLTVGFAPIAAAPSAMADKPPADFGARLTRVHAAVLEYQGDTQLPQIIQAVPPSRQNSDNWRTAAWANAAWANAAWANAAWANAAWANWANIP